MIDDDVVVEEKAEHFITFWNKFKINSLKVLNFLRFENFSYDDSLKSLALEWFEFEKWFWM
jgi:hypothetical protein